MEVDKTYQVGISTDAAEKVKEQLAKRGTPEAYLRLGVKGGGCSGFSYVLRFEDSAPKPKDIVFDIEGVHIVVDNKSILYLNGCILDWEKTLMNHGFQIVNPNEKSKCGCGQSFTI